MSNTAFFAEWLNTKLNLWSLRDHTFWLKQKGRGNRNWQKTNEREKGRKEGNGCLKTFWSFSLWGGQEHRNCGWALRTEADKATSCSPFQIHNNNAKTTCKNTAKGKQGFMVSLMCQIILVYLSSYPYSRGLWVNSSIAVPETYQDSFQGCPLYVWTQISMLHSLRWTKMKLNPVTHLNLQPRPGGSHVGIWSFLTACPSQTLQVR